MTDYKNIGLIGLLVLFILFFNSVPLSILTLTTAGDLNSSSTTSLISSGIQNGVNLDDSEISGAEVLFLNDESTGTTIANHWTTTAPMSLTNNDQHVAEYPTFATLGDGSPYSLRKTSTRDILINSGIATGRDTFTYALWFNPDSIGSTQHLITESETSSWGRTSVTLQTDGKVAFCMGNTVNQDCATTTNSASAGAWNSVIVTGQETTNSMSITLNGGTTATASKSQGSWQPGVAEFQIGSSAWDSNDFTGYIDNIMTLTTVASDTVKSRYHQYGLGTVSTLETSSVAITKCLTSEVENANRIFINATQTLNGGTVTYYHDIGCTGDYTEATLEEAIETDVYNTYAIKAALTGSTSASPVITSLQVNNSLVVETVAGASTVQSALQSVFVATNIADPEGNIAQPINGAKALWLRIWEAIKSLLRNIGVIA